MTLLVGARAGRSPEVLQPDVRVPATSILTLYLVLLYAISARQVIGVLGAVGTPAMMLAVLALPLWLGGWLLPRTHVGTDPHPLRPMLLLYFAAMVGSYAVAMSRPLTELEMSGAHRALITIVALTGIAVLAADALPDRERVSTVLRRVVLAGTAFSLLGIAQFVTGLDLQPPIPGLVFNQPETGVLSRSIFNRPTGTALHPIEFSVVTAGILPLAIHFALYGRTIHQRRNYAVATAVIALAVPLSLSRSGLLALIVGLAVLAAGWGARRRLNLLLAGLAAVPVLWLTVDGLVGTLTGLFTNTSTDPSIQARLDRIPRIMGLIRDRPWLGRGNGTYSVEDYFLIDNEVWVTTIETGVIGMFLTAALIAVGIVAALLIKSLPGVDERQGHLSHAVGASIAAFGLSLATFDAFFYHILTGTLFLLLGTAGALWRLHRPADLWRLLRP